MKKAPAVTFLFGGLCAYVRRANPTGRITVVIPAPDPSLGVPAHEPLLLAAKMSSTEFFDMTEKRGLPMALHDGLLASVSLRGTVVTLLTEDSDLSFAGGLKVATKPDDSILKCPKASEGWIDWLADAEEMTGAGTVRPEVLSADPPPDEVLCRMTLGAGDVTAIPRFAGVDGVLLVGRAADRARAISVGMQWVPPAAPEYVLSLRAGSRYSYLRLKAEDGPQTIAILNFPASPVANRGRVATADWRTFDKLLTHGQIQEAGVHGRCNNSEGLLGSVWGDCPGLMFNETRTVGFGSLERASGASAAQARQVKRRR